jgi:hypothetical protein
MSADTTRMLALLFAVAALSGGSVEAVSAAGGLPLPAAPVRVVIPDAAAFDAALGGAFRRVLSGEPEDGDPVVAGWRRTRVGTKLEDQWTRLSKDLPWTWQSLHRLHPRSVGIALLQVGELEAVLVVDTPLAVLPLAPPIGKPFSHGGIAYSVVARGAGDTAADPDRRMGLAWARAGDRLFLATSERALLLALDEQLAGRGFDAPLPGLVSVDLDLKALRSDRYFRREFLFGEGPEQDHVRAALRVEAGGLVEVREGSGEGGSPAASFEAKGAIAMGWEPSADGLGSALRAALLEPIPSPSERPVPALAPLPAATAKTEDRYLVSLATPRPQPGGPAFEEGELSSWQALWQKQSVSGFGYAVSASGVRRLVFAWPETLQAELLGLCRATIERRAGRAVVADVGDTKEVRVGPGLPVVALRRTGGYVWIGPSAQDLADVAAPRPSEDLVRWARLDLDAARGEAPRWAKAEGPEAPEQTRAFSDRILGLLGWIGDTRTLSVERKKTPTGWSERVVFGATPR